MKNVICLTDTKGERAAYVVNINAADAIKRFLEGIPNYAKFVSGFEVKGKWNDKLLYEYQDTMEEASPGGWEYPGIYVPGNPKVPRFSIDAWQPKFVLVRWYGDANEIEN